MFKEALLIPSVANWVPGVDPDNSLSDSDAASERSLMGVPVSIKGKCPARRELPAGSRHR